MSYSFHAFKKKLSNMQVILLVSFIAVSAFTTTSIILYLQQNNSPLNNENHVLDLPCGNELYYSGANDIVSSYLMESVFDPGGSGVGLYFYDVIVSESEFLDYLNLDLNDVLMRNGTRRVLLQKISQYGCSDYVALAFYDLEDSTWRVRRTPTLLSSYEWVLEQAIKQTYLLF